VRQSINHLSESPLHAVDGNQAAMDVREDGFFACPNAFSDHLTRLASPPGCLLARNLVQTFRLLYQNRIPMLPQLYLSLFTNPT
jgi:hypothetical protein